MDGQIDRHTDRQEQSLPGSLLPTEPENQEGRPRGNSTSLPACLPACLPALPPSVSQSCLRNLCRHPKTAFRRRFSAEAEAAGRNIIPCQREIDDGLTFIRCGGIPQLSAASFFPPSAQRPNPPQKNLSEMSSAKYRSGAAGDFAHVPSFVQSFSAAARAIIFVVSLLLLSSLHPELQRWCCWQVW